MKTGETYTVQSGFSTGHACWAWWCTPVMPVAQEAEAGESQVQSQPQEKQGAKQSSETLSLNKIQTRVGMWLSGQVPLSSIPSTK